MVKVKGQGKSFISWLRHKGGAGKRPESLVPLGRHTRSRDLVSSSSKSVIRVTDPLTRGSWGTVPLRTRAPWWTEASLWVCFPGGHLVTVLQHYWKSRGRNPPRELSRAQAESSA